MTQDSPGCGYQDGEWQINIGNFSGGWQAGDILHIFFENTLNGESEFFEIILENQGQSYYITLNSPSGSSSQYLSHKALIQFIYPWLSSDFLMDNLQLNPYKSIFSSGLNQTDLTRSFFYSPGYPQGYPLVPFIGWWTYQTWPFFIKDAIRWSADFPCTSLIYPQSSWSGEGYLWPESFRVWQLGWWIRDQYSR